MSRVAGASLSTYSISARVKTTIVSLQVLSQTFKIAILTIYSGLISISIVIILDISNSLYSFTVDSDSIYWISSNLLSTTSQINPLSLYLAKSIVLSTRSTSAVLNIAVNALQYSSTDIFANNAITNITIDINRTLYYYSRTSFSDFITVTGTTTVTTPVVNTNNNNSRSTISATVVVVKFYGV